MDEMQPLLRHFLIFAAITPGNLGPNQPLPRSPGKDWPEKP